MELAKAGGCEERVISLLGQWGCLLHWACIGHGFDSCCARRLEGRLASMVRWSRRNPTESRLVEPGMTGGLQICILENISLTRRPLWPLSSKLG
jgi:hypothetical protein